MDERRRKRVSVEEVTAEMAVVLREKSVAKITQTEGGLQIRLINGQNFRVEVKEE